MYFKEISVLQKSTLTKGAFSQKELSEKRGKACLVSTNTN